MNRLTIHRGLLLLFAIAGLIVGPAAFAGAAATSPFCVACVSIRIGPPHIVRGPIGDEADNHFAEIQLGDGRYRGFTANGTTYAIDGNQPGAMGGRAVPVLRPGPPSTSDSCGQWLNSVEPMGPVLLGFVHKETGCDYNLGQTHKSMSIETSSDQGLTWIDSGSFIAGDQPPAHAKTTGEGDCSVVRKPDGYFYAYCLRARDWATIVARAPISDPKPDRWMKYFQGAWSEPGVRGDATPLVTQDARREPVRGSASVWTLTRQTLILGLDTPGLVLFFSADGLDFDGPTAPLLALDPQTWQRPAPSELVAYAALIDARTGSSQIGSAAKLVYTYLKPGEDFSKRYLVIRDVDITLLAESAVPQVRVVLARWTGANGSGRTSSVGPVGSGQSGEAVEANSGYLMTAPDPHRASVALDECAKPIGDQTDLMLAADGCPASPYSRLRPAGWAYQASWPGTRALYRCVDPARHTHFASNDLNCERLGKPEVLLGYVLAE